MFSSIQSLGVSGIGGYLVSVEVNISNGMPHLDIVGLPDAAVKEARERAYAAVKNNGFHFTASRLTVNLAPADKKKTGTVYDLPILVGILAASGDLQKPKPDTAFIGELSLTGELRPVRGALPMALAAEREGLRRLFVPAANAPACASSARRGNDNTDARAEPCDRRLGSAGLCRCEGPGERQARL